MTEIEQIKAKLSIADVVKKYVPELNRSGRNYKARCPFHQESSPSFMVNDEMGIFKCFGCGEGGDIFSFVEKIERIPFADALKLTAEWAGVVLPDRTPKKNPEHEKKLQRLKEANTIATKYFNYLLVSHDAGKSALAYTNNRGISNKEIELFQLGYAPEGQSLRNFMIKKGFTDKELLEFSLTVEKRGQFVDKFRDRLMFPIFNLRGEVVGFSGRTLQKDGIPKYLNTGETPIYKKSEVPYGIYQAKDAMRIKNFAIIFEGNVDIVNSHRLGVANVVCPLGTALTIEQLKLIKRYCEQVYFCFDTDEAGFKALLRSIPLAEQLGLQHKVIELGKYHDADDLMMSDAKAWPERIADAVDSLDFVLKQLKQQHDISTASGKQGLRDDFMAVLNNIRDTVVISHYRKKLAGLIDVEPEMIQLKSMPAKKPIDTDEVQAELEKPKEKLPIQYTNRELQLIKLLLHHGLDNQRDIDLSVVKSAPARELLGLILQHGVNGLDKANNKLSAATQDLLQEAMLAPISDAESKEDEFMRVYRRLYLQQLRQRIMQVNKQLQKDTDDDESKIETLQELTTELHRLTSNQASWPKLSIMATYENNK